MISLDTLRFLRKKKFWIALIGVLVCAVVIFVNLDNEEEREYAQIYANATTIDISSSYIDDDEYNKGIKKVASEYKESVKQKDWKKIHESTRNLYLINASRIAVYAQNDDPDMYYHNYLKNKDIVEEMIDTYKLPVLDKSKLDDNGFVGMSVVQQVPLFAGLQFQARFHDALAKQNIDQLTYSSVDSSTVFVQFIRLMFPLLPIIVIAIMCYDSLQEDKDSGVVKVLLTQPTKRSIYIRKKILLNIKSTLFIFLVPMLVLSLGFGLFDHYKTLRAPVLANTQGITSLHVMENTLPEIQKNGGVVDNIGITRYFSIPHQYNSPNPEFDFMEMWQFTLLCVAMMILVLIFLVLLTTLMTIIVHNKIFALAIALAVMFVGVFLARPENTANIYGYLPFTYMNPVDILSGFSSFTYLSGMLVLIVSNVILYGLCLRIYKRKDVIC